MLTGYVTPTSSVTKEMTHADNTDIAFKTQIMYLNIRVANIMMDKAAEHWETVNWN